MNGAPEHGPREDGEDPGGKSRAEERLGEDHHHKRAVFRDPVQVGRKPDLVFVLSEDAGFAGVIPLLLRESGPPGDFRFAAHRHENIPRHRYPALRR